MGTSSSWKCFHWIGYSGAKEVTGPAKARFPLARERLSAMLGTGRSYGSVYPGVNEGQA